MADPPKNVMDKWTIVVCGVLFRICTHCYAVRRDATASPTAQAHAPGSSLGAAMRKRGKTVGVIGRVSVDRISLGSTVLLPANDHGMP